MNIPYRTNLEALFRLRGETLLGKPKRIEWQHQRGKPTARERNELLLDE